MSPEQLVRELTERLADPGVDAAERRRLRVLRLVAALIDDPDGNHDAAVDEIVGDWAPGSTGGSSEVEVELPGQGGAFGPVSLDARDAGDDRIDVVVSPGDLPVSVSVGVVVRNGRIALDTSRVPESLPGVDLTPLHARAHRLIVAHNRRRSGRRPLPDGMAAVEADVRAVMAELEAAGRPVTAGAIRAEYGGTKNWDPETDSMDPEMEEVFRRLDLPGAHPPPEPLPVLGAVAAPAPTAEDSPTELPLVPWDAATVAIEDRPEVRLSYSIDGRWQATIKRRDEEPVTFEIHPRVVVGATIDLHEVQALLATKGIGIEPHQDHLTHWGTLGDQEELGQASYVDPRPMVNLYPNLKSDGSRLVWGGWTVRVTTGDPATSFQQAVDDRHVTADGVLNLASLDEELRVHGIALDVPDDHLLAPEGSGSRSALPGTRYLDVPVAQPPAGDDPDGTSWLPEILRSGKGKLVIGGAAGFMVLGFLVPQLVGDDDTPPDTTTTTVDEAAATTRTPPDASAPSGADPEPPAAAAEPPPGYVPPVLSFAPDGPPARAADRGSLWGTNAWPTVISTSTGPGSPPPTVYPQGAVFEAEFVIDAECDEAGTCTYSIPRGTTDSGEQAHVPLTLDGLTLTGPGDDLAEGCTGESGVEFVVSDLTLVGSRLVPTYMTGRRWFREDCPSWNRVLENTYNAHYVDRPSLTPSS